MATFGSLFAGIGGLDLGLERSGWECKWQVEIDPCCQKVLQKHWPDVPKYGDIFDVDFTKTEPVDLICGGFPCQPFSVTGQRKGAADERYLWPEFARAISQAKPRWVLLENVPGLLAMAGEYGQILSNLASCGYDAEWDCIPAAAFGLKHLRKRVFIIAGTGKMDNPNCFDSRSFTRHAASYRRWAENAPSRSCFGRRAGAREPRMARVAYGVPARVDRLRALGNAVVPQVAEWIGRRILQATKAGG